MLFVITVCIIIANCLGLEIECPAPIDFPLDQSGKCSPMLQCVIDRDCPDSLICCPNNCTGMFCRKSVAQLNYRTGARVEMNSAEGSLVCSLKQTESSITCEAHHPEQKRTSTTVAPPVTTKPAEVKETYSWLRSRTEGKPVVGGTTGYISHHREPRKMLNFNKA